MLDSTMNMLLTRARLAIEAGDTAAAKAAWDEAEQLGNLEGVSVRDRIGLPRSSASQLSWSLWGAVDGDTSAMFSAACCYRDGVGTKRNAIQAVRWYLTMIDHDDIGAVHEAIEAVKHGMTNAEIIHAGVLAGQAAHANVLIQSVPTEQRRGWRRTREWWQRLRQRCD